MSVREAKLIAHQFLEEIWNRGNISLIDEMFSETCVYRAEGAQKSAGMPVGHLKTCISNVRRAFPDLRISQRDVIAEDNKIAIRWTARGTHQAEFLGLRSTGKEFTLSGVAILIIEQKKICNTWMFAGLSELIAQLKEDKGVHRTNNCCLSLKAQRR